MYLAVFKHGFLRSPFAGVGVLMKECTVVFQVAKDVVKKNYLWGFLLLLLIALHGCSMSVQF